MRYWASKVRKSFIKNLFGIYYIFIALIFMPNTAPAESKLQKYQMSVYRNAYAKELKDVGVIKLYSDSEIENYIKLCSIIDYEIDYSDDKEIYILLNSKLANVLEEEN